MPLIAALNTGWALFFAAVFLALVWAAWRWVSKQRDRIARLTQELEECRSAPPVELTPGLRVYQNQEDIKRVCTALREDAVEIHGIWCSRYDVAEITRYFEEEHKALVDDPHLKIHRIVNPTAVGEAFDDFHARWSRSREQDRWNIKVNPNIVDVELMHVRYPSGRPRRSVGVIVVNQFSESTKAPDPALALVFDPSENQWLEQAVSWIERWFTGYFNRRDSKPLTRDYVRTWDQEVARVYDRCVWQNTRIPEFFKTYLREEERLVFEILNKQAVNTPDRKLSVVEVGCGTGRALLRYADAVPADRIEYLIGFDSSRGMIAEAEHALEAAKARAENHPEHAALLRVRLAVLDAFDMNRDFEHGRLLSASAGDIPWFPENCDVNEMQYLNSRKVFCCLLNTLGVFDDANRPRVLHNMIRALGPGDVLVLSMLDGGIFEWGAQLFYREIAEVTRATEGQEQYDTRQAVFTTTADPPYWSRWLFLDGESQGRKVPHIDTVYGLLEDAEHRLAPDFRFDYEIFPIQTDSDPDRLANLVVLTRE